MTARQPRRTRRRNVPATSLPRPSGGDENEELRRSTSTVTRSAVSHREHHVMKDYSYIRRDLFTVAGVGILVIAFIVGMSFVI